MICVVFMCSNIIAQFMITLESFVVSVQDAELYCSQFQTFRRFSPLQVLQLTVFSFHFVLPRYVCSLQRFVL